MKDERLYAKFTLDFPDHPKILTLSVEAKWALVEMTIYSRRHMTDGWLSKPVALAKWGAAVCQELATNDAENPSLIEAERGWQIHDFAAHQSTKAEIEALAEKRRAAGQKGGKARAKQVLNQEPQQNPSKIKPETETETETYKRKDLLTADASSGTSTPTDITCAYPKAFESWWDHYPRKAGKRKALAAWKRARKRATDQQLIDGAIRYANDPHRTDEYTKYPEGWLNRDGWLDDPLPGPKAGGIEW